ncbi:MAG: flavodoxin family protein [Syntrophobacteraceae bacterium]
MLVVAIYGSPRKHGNTDLMADAFLEGASSAPNLRVERIYVRDLSISGCLGCGHCDNKGVCIQRDDMDSVIPLLDSADRVVMASPIYFYGLPGQLKLLVDRSQAPFMRRELKKKEGEHSPPVLAAVRKGFLLSAGATRGKRLFECAVLTAKYFFDALDIASTGELCFREIDEKGSLLRHPTAIEQCRRAGREFVAE